MSCVFWCLFGEPKVEASTNVDKGKNKYWGWPVTSVMPCLHLQLAFWLTGLCTFLSFSSSFYWWSDSWPKHTILMCNRQLWTLPGMDQWGRCSGNGCIWPWAKDNTIRTDHLTLTQHIYWTQAGHHAPGQGWENVPGLTRHTIFWGNSQETSHNQCAKGQRLPTGNNGVTERKNLVDSYL